MMTTPVGSRVDATTQTEPTADPLALNNTMKELLQGVLAQLNAMHARLDRLERVILTDAATKQCQTLGAIHEMLL